MAKCYKLCYNDGHRLRSLTFTCLSQVYDVGVTTTAPKGTELYVFKKLQDVRTFRSYYTSEPESYVILEGEAPELHPCSTVAMWPYSYQAFWERWVVRTMNPPPGTYTVTEFTGAEILER